MEKNLRILVSGFLHLRLLQIPEKFIPFDVCLFENSEHRPCGKFRMVGDRDKPMAFRVKEVDVTARLPHRAKSENSEDFDYFTS
jgi:hypothetical protein